MKGEREEGWESSDLTERTTLWPTDGQRDTKAES